MKNLAIRENHLFNKAYRSDKRYSGRYVYVYVLRDYMAKKIMRADPMKKYTNRLGISVSKKVGSAVRRNRAKRIIRAAYYSLRPTLSTGYLVVIAAKQSISAENVRVTSNDITRELSFAFSKLGLVKK